MANGSGAMLSATPITPHLAGLSLMSAITLIGSAIMMVAPASKNISIAQPIGRIDAPGRIKKNSEEKSKTSRLAVPPTSNAVNPNLLARITPVLLT